MSEKRLDSLMTALCLSEPDHSCITEQGNLNSVHHVMDSSGREFILRIHDETKRQDISSYLNAQYRQMGLNIRGGQIRFRTVPEQVQTLAYLSSRDIRVPEIIDHGEDWILMSKAEGIPLKDCLSLRPRHTLKGPINAVLSQAMDAHKKGACLWDRWGANELVDEVEKNSFNVTFIDFDLEIIWPDSIPQKIMAAFDLAVLLRGCIHFATDKNAAGKAVIASLSENIDFENDYDTEALADFLEGQIEFYTQQYCHNKSTAQKDREDQYLTNVEMMKICNYSRGMSAILPGLYGPESSLRDSFASLHMSPPK